MTPQEFVKWLDEMIVSCDTAASYEVSPAREYWSGQSYGLTLVKEKYLSILTPSSTNH